jgi:hypothetical protein
VWLRLIESATGRFILAEAGTGRALALWSV